MSIRRQKIWSSEPRAHQFQRKNYKYLLQLLPPSAFTTEQICFLNFLKGKDHVLVKESKMTVTNDPKVYWLRYGRGLFLIYT